MGMGHMTNAVLMVWVATGGASSGASARAASEVALGIHLSAADARVLTGTGPSQGSCFAEQNSIRWREQPFAVMRHMHAAVKAAFDF